MAFELVQIQPRIFYAKFEELQHMLLSTYRIDAVRIEQKLEYENYRQYIKNYMHKFNYNGCCIYSKDIRLFLKKFKRKKAISEELTFAMSILNITGQAGLTSRSKFTVIVCYNAEGSIAFNHEMAHSLFYVDYQFRMKVLRLFKHVKADIKQKMFDDLAKSDYKFRDIDDPAFIDEAFCRLATENLLKKGFSEDIKLPQRQIAKFKKLYQDNLKRQ